jgi:hypothetical protein
MSSDLHVEPAARAAGGSSRWAPWWAYAVVIVPANLGTQQLIPGDVAWWLRAALTATIVVAGIAIVTAIHRAASDGRAR